MPTNTLWIACLLRRNTASVGARHWLDLVRYAETNGYEFDSLKPEVWRYRDYVIDSFNADKPYDQFIREQLAGDELGRSSRRKQSLRPVTTGWVRWTAERRTGCRPSSTSWTTSWRPRARCFWA